MVWSLVGAKKTLGIAIRRQDTAGRYAALWGRLQGTQNRDTP
jgi:hypothetical protein